MASQLKATQDSCFDFSVLNLLETQRESSDIFPGLLSPFESISKSENRSKVHSGSDIQFEADPASPENSIFKATGEKKCDQTISLNSYLGAEKNSDQIIEEAKKSFSGNEEI